MGSTADREELTDPDPLSPHGEEAQRLGPPGVSLGGLFCGHRDRTYQAQAARALGVWPEAGLMRRRVPRNAPGGALEGGRGLVLLYWYLTSAMD